LAKNRHELPDEKFRNFFLLEAQIRIPSGHSSVNDPPTIHLLTPNGEGKGEKQAPSR
jgi:hypothetical protein